MKSQYISLDLFTIYCVYEGEINKGTEPHLYFTNKHEFMGNRGLFGLFAGFNGVAVFVHSIIVLMRETLL